MSLKPHFFSVNCSIFGTGKICEKKGTKKRQYEEGYYYKTKIWKKILMTNIKSFEWMY